jgi:hypothetical protein
MYASVLIPKGYKATHTIIYGTVAGGRTFQTFTANINSPTIGALHLATNVGTEVEYGSAASPSVTSYLLIRVIQTATSDGVYGGAITIEST